MALYKIKYKLTKIGETEIFAKNKTDATSLITAAIKTHVGEKEGKVLVKAIKIKEIKD
jgi:hypothetical protein